MTTATSSDELGELYCATCERQFVAGPRCPDDGTMLVRLTAAADPLLGRELDGRFTIIEKLGQGGMGAVYRARQHSMGREVAVKVLSAGLVSDATSIKRFLREAKLASRLAHPNVVSVLDFGQTQDGVFYLVMELVEGQTLHAVLKREGKLDLPRMRRITTQICDALDGAHALPIMHRDLKPSNVMVLARGRDLVKVLDFGLAKSLSPDNTGGTVTSAGALLGTPAFMPPEVARGLAADSRADLYSLGCMMYVMGTGQPPFVTDSVLEMVALHGTQPAPPMTGVPEAIAAVVDRLLQKEPERRYQTASAVRSALEDAYELSRASRPSAAVTTSRYPIMLTKGSEKPSVEHLAIPEGRAATAPDDNADTMSMPGASASAMTLPEVPASTMALPVAPASTPIPPEAPANRRVWLRRVALVAIMLGVAIGSVAVLYSSSWLPDPDRPEGGPIVEPASSQPTPSQPTSSQPTSSQTAPQPPSQPPVPPASDHTIVTPSDPATNRPAPDSITNRHGERSTKRKKPGAASKTAPASTKLHPPQPLPQPQPPPAVPEPSSTEAGSGVRPGTGSNAPF